MMLVLELMDAVAGEPGTILGDFADRRSPMRNIRPSCGLDSSSRYLALSATTRRQVAEVCIVRAAAWSISGSLRASGASPS